MNKFAISSGGLGAALERSASSLAAANNTLEQSAALITAANEVVQNPEKVGTAFKTISMRIRGAKTELEEAGESTEGMVESTATLRAEIQALSGVDIMLDKDNFKSTYQIMDELSQKWENLSDIQQATITELMAGKHQGNVFASLMTNFDTAREALKASIGAEGSALTEHEKWSQSIEARLNKLSASWQAFSQAFMNSDALKVGIDLLSGFLDILEKIIDNFGLIGTIGLGTLGKGLFEYFKFIKSGGTEVVKTISDVVDAINNLPNAMNNVAQSASNVTDTITDVADSTADVVDTVTDVADSVTDTIDAATDIADTTADAVSTVADTADAISDVADVASDATDVITDLGGAVTKTSGGFKAFMKTPIGVASAIGVLVAAVGLAINAYKNYREEQSKLRQEAIETSDKFLDSTLAFEQAYVKYSEKTGLTLSEEEDLKSAIDGTVSALGDKSSALQNVVNNSGDYLAYLEAIKNAELEAANRAAKTKRDNAETELKDTVKGWTSIDGSEVDANISNNEVRQIAQEIGGKYLKTASRTAASGNGATHALTLDPKADIKEILNYYHTLEDIRDRLEAEGLKDTAEYGRIKNSIDKMSGAIETYESGLYDAAKAQYQLTNGIPKTAEEYLKMRESILGDMGDLPSDVRRNIANTLDSEYGQIFNLSDAKIQARKLIGIVDEFGDAEASQMEAFINMRTAVNNDECSVGDYMSQFNEINAMTQDWDEKSKEEFNIAFGIDADNIKTQYDNLYNYLSHQDLPWFDDYEFTPEFRIEKENIKDQEVRKFLDDLTASELTAVASIRTEIDWENTDIEDIRKIIQKQVGINKAMAFTTDIKVDTTALELLNTALTESASAMGLTEESIDSLKAKYSKLESFDAATLFEATANGVKVNREELAKLEKEYNDLTKSEVKEHIDSLAEAYNDVTAEIDKCKNAGERAQLLSKREGYKTQIEELAEYQAQLEGVTGAYQRWIDAQNTPEDYEGYQAIATSREDIEDEIDRGFISNATKEYIDLLSGEDLVGGTIDDYAEAWERLDKKVGSTSYSIHDFFTVNDDGDITATGIDRFFDGLQQDFKGSVYKLNEESGKWEYDFSQENLQKIQDEWGIGIEAIELLLEAAASAGYDIDWGGILDGIDLDTSNFETLVSYAEKAQKAFNELEGVEDVDFNFTATGVEEATSELEKARSTYVDLITNDDGSINLKAEGADQMRVILSTLLVQKQQLEDSNIAINIDTSGLDESQQDISNAIEAVKTFREKYKNLEIAVTTGQGIDTAKSELSKAMGELQTLGGEGVDIAAQLILGEGTDGETLKTKVDAAITAVGDKNIKVGCKLDETAIGDLNSQVLTNFTPEATVKITGIDDALVNQYTSTEKTAEGTVKWKNDESLVVEYQEKTKKAVGIVDWANNTDNVKKSFSANGTVKWTSGNKVKVDVISEAKGTAHSNGTANSGRAFARGNWGINGNGTALGGELGQELVVRDGKFFTIGDNGAEFFKYKQNDIVFNAAQTESLFKYGGIKGAKPRGTMLANGSAFSEGSISSNGRAFAWTAEGTKLGFANKRKNTAKKKAETKTSTTTKDNSVTTTTTTSWSANASESNFAKDRNNKPSDSSSKSNSSSSSSSTKEEFEETFDWVEIAISRIEREIDNLDQKANRTYKSWSSRNKALTSEIGKVGDEIDLQQKAYDRYIKEANSVGLSSSWAEKVRNGEIDIESIEDEGLAEKIKDYQNWYEKALACKDAIEDLKDTEAELYRQRFDNIQSQYDGILQGYEHTETMLNEYISQAEAQGHIISEKYYQALINNEEQNIAQLKKEQSALIEARNEAEANGIDKNSQDWLDMCAEIDAVTQAIEEGTTSIIEYNNAIRDIEWEKFDLIQERISDITAESEFLIELMSNDKLFDDKGKLTGQGAATMGLHALNYNTAMYQADDYDEEIAQLDKQIAKDPYDQNLINRRRELIEAQRESILEAEDEKQSIKDLVEEGINLELDALQELINKKNEELESEKELYEYQKKVQEQTESIASLRKQMAAYENDDSEEAKAKIQELKISLEEAETELKETEWDKYISDTSALLDTLYTDYETILNARLDDVDYLLRQVIDGINIASGALGSEGAIASALGSDGAIASALGSEGTLATALGVEGAIASAIVNAMGENGSIKSILNTEVTGVGTTLSTAMDNIWSVGEGNAKSVLTTYGEDFQGKQTTTNEALGSIKADVAAMVDDIDKDAQKKVEAPKTPPSSKSDPTKGNNSNNGNKGNNNENKQPSKPTITDDTIKGIAAAIWVYGSNSGWGNNPFRENKLTSKIGTSNAKKVQDYINKHGSNGDLYNFWIQKGKNLDKYKYNAFKTGAKEIDVSQLAWTQENGQEYIIRPSDGAILTPVAKGDSVLNATASGNIWSMANNPVEFIRDNLKLDTSNVPNGANAQSNLTQHFENINFNMPNVHSYNELLTEMQKDKNFENLILAMTVNQIAGKSKLTKGKAIR